MKYLIALTLLLPVAAFSQECSIQKETDPFDQQQRLTTGFLKLGRHTVSMVADSKEIRFLFALADSPCFSDTSSMVVLYEGNKNKANLKSTGSMNCEGMFVLIFRNTNTTPSALQKFTTQPVASFRFRSSSGKIIELDLREDEKAFFMKSAACLTQEAKTLIK